MYAIRTSQTTIQGKTRAGDLCRPQAVEIGADLHSTRYYLLIMEVL